MHKLFKTYLQLTLSKVNSFFCFNRKQKHPNKLDDWHLGTDDVEKKTVLIVGNLRHWDSLSKHTEFFLNATDFQHIRLFLYREEEHRLYQYYDRTHCKKLAHLPIANLDCSQFDLVIYTSPLTHNSLTTLNWKDEKYISSVFPVKKAPFNVAYSVWDGTIAHPKWVEIINSYFDAVFVPQQHMCDYLINSGVTKPAFPLLNAFDYQEFINSTRHPLNQPFVFGINATFEQRKNVYKTASAFIKAFGHQADVKLHIHMRYMTTDPNNPKVLSFMEMIKPYKNIVFDNTCLSIEDNKNLMKSYDAYVLPSMAEGYSVTPREALACGHVLILSDIKTHKTITNLKEDSGVFWIKADRPVTIEQLDLPLGKMFDCQEQDLTKVFQYVYQHRERLFSKHLIQKRKHAALQFDASVTGKLFQTVLTPKKLKLSKHNRVTKDCIETNSISLFWKYNHYMQPINSVVFSFDREIDFFANFNKYISSLYQAPANMVIIPDWRLQPLDKDTEKNTNKIFSKSFFHIIEKNKNIFWQFFKQKHSTYSSGKFSQMDRLYPFTSENLSSFAIKEYLSTNIPSSDLYIEDRRFLFFREAFHQMLQKHVYLQPNIQKAIDHYCNKNIKEKFVISAFIEDDIVGDEISSLSKTFRLWDTKLNEILKKEKITTSSDNWRFLILSPNQDAFTYFHNKYPQNILFHKIQNTAKPERGIKRSVFLKNLKDSIIGVYVAARTNYLICTNSNMSMMASYINPKLKMVYCQKEQKA